MVDGVDECRVNNIRVDGMDEFGELWSLRSLR